MTKFEKEPSNFISFKFSHFKFILNCVYGPAPAISNFKFNFMFQVDVNYAAIVIAAAANMALGFLWYGPRPHNPNTLISRCQQFSKITRRSEEAVIPVLR
ncbi:MAG: hypothetical protein A3D44_02305 [Candidatus Staskawiczbacteria bacterium RIFCSPHIGHO2_02_FULL_42_22]|uniref:Uncharacterized protein n=1 Tax=Candidatus Staskawiczbacteria bacterium RIFCSPHIGHO2_02_FULL_42_22 TaxID=1802207 RepID=A0A1G2I1Y8_9BACT|nr:MAG: hypothetical protein A3D44_02305 [Candidatus Staskawiczbacteria bacterium RIFCSPHIGHO2_02_FULL_42_22]